MAWSATNVIAILALIGATLMTLLGVIEGNQAVTLYGIILGYVFGYQVGNANHHRRA